MDVVMVWHAHMLNPRSFLEDCIRYGKMSFWNTGLPWGVINSCLDNHRFEYNAGDRALNAFELKTNHAWDNLHDPVRKELQCPLCKASVHVRWTAGHIPYKSAVPFEKYYGYADKSLNVTCRRCKFIITGDQLKIAKFRQNLLELRYQDLPMPGTFLNLQGIPQTINKSQHRSQHMFPNQVLNTMTKHILDVTYPGICKTMSQLRDQFSMCLTDPDVLRSLHGPSNIVTHRREEKIAFRRMMSAYWDNLSIFSMDLVGAVIRQGTFIQKMDNIDWLHSPTLTRTMTRLITKYNTFFNIMVTNPEHMAVPTLDVDLAWHTHQLSPYRYYHYSLHQTYMYAPSTVAFIDHDDKVEEDKLSDGFAWTAKMYKKHTNGQIYSECTCWYCEATRGPDLESQFSSLFVSGATQRARDNVAALHDRSDISTDPDKNAHISAHNAVAPDTSDGPRAAFRRLKALQLQTNHARAMRRAEKRHHRTSTSTSNPNTNGKNRSNDPASAYASTPYVYGIPIAVPYYAPYMCDPSVHADAYAGNPSCMSFVPGAHGNCAVGSCGGAVAAGSCGGLGGGGCSGGCAGGGCGGSGGGCGGGGGGC